MDTSLFRTSRKILPEILEVGPRGLRLLVPRRPLVGFELAASVILWSAYVWVLFFVVVPRWAPQDFVGGALILLAFFAGATAFWAVRLPPWLLASQPRRTLDIQVRRIDLRRTRHWIWVRADGQETWLQVPAVRRRLEAALAVSGHFPGATAARG